MTKEQNSVVALEAFNIIISGMVKLLPTAKLITEHGFDIRWSGSDLKNFLNPSFKNSAVRTLDELRDSFEYLRQKYIELDTDHAGGLAVIEIGSLLEEGISKETIKEIVSSYGFGAHLNDTMRNETSLPFKAIDTKDLKIKKTTNAKELREIFLTMLDMYGKPFPDVPDWIPAMSYWETVYSYVGYVDDIVVTTASAIVHEDKVFVACVATHPDFRRRGYATAITKYAMQKAHEATGATVSLLHASSMGNPVYEKMGFNTIGSVAFAFFIPVISEKSN
jgi:ribosomal protein S18 acetylase RimI-like enzyme